LVPFVPWWFKSLGLIATPIVQKNVLTPRADPEPLPRPKKAGSRNFTTKDGGRRARVSMRVETTSEISCPPSPAGWDKSGGPSPPRTPARRTSPRKETRCARPPRPGGRGAPLCGSPGLVRWDDRHEKTLARRNANALEERTSPTTESQTGASAQRSAIGMKLAGNRSF
jgi:hypothetical protein